MSRRRRRGTRSAIAASAESLSPAVRVSWPSSLRMPATSSRISASSSTTRISDAILDLFRPFFFLCLPDLKGRENHADHGSATPMEIFWRIMQLQPPTRVFDNFLHNSQPEPGSLLTGGHIGLEQALSVLFRQSLAGIDHQNLDLGPEPASRNPDDFLPILF